MDLTIPSERTITLLAGLFKRSPQALVEGTTYPLAKAERLPEVACCFTALEHELALLDNDLAWLRRLADHPDVRHKNLSLAAEVQAQWSTRLEVLREQITDEGEKRLLEAARQKLNDAKESSLTTKGTGGELQRRTQRKKSKQVNENQEYT
jgi:hypothetical protein